MQFSKSFHKLGRVVFFLVLGSVFLVRSYESMQKLLQKSVVTLTSEEPLGDFYFPSTTVCKVLTDLNSVFDSQFKVTDTAVSSLIVGLYLENGRSKNMVHESVIEELGQNFEDIWHFTIHFGFDKDFKLIPQICVSFNHFQKSRSGVWNQVLLYLNTSGNEDIRISLHDKNAYYQFYLNGLNGISSFIVNPREFNTSNINFLGNNFKKTEYKRLKTEKNQCSQEKDYNVPDCIEEHHAKELGCAMPWFKDYIKAKAPSICGQDRVEDLQDMIFFGLYWGGEADVANITGCPRTCSSNQYIKLDTIPQRQTKNLNMSVLPQALKRIYDANTGLKDYLIVALTFVGNEYEFLQQAFFFDINDFIGNVGGYLGILLGISCMTIWDIIEYLVLKLWNRNHSSRCDA